ncbi:MAG: hypothetical protein H0V89_10955 [Deltaproteobacteria bacterium]|nr:hypothetical protein [Deltaproteobacteria bacterium]
MSRTTRTTDLQKRATELEEELGQFERLGEEALGIALDSQKNLDRSRRLLDKLADAETRLNQAAGALALLLGGIRDRQQRSADEITAWARALQERIDGWNAMQQNFLGLATSATDLQEALQRAAGDPAAVAEIQGLVEALAEQAGKLAGEAGAAGYRDLQRDAEARRDQLQSSARKLAELRSRLS